MNISYALFPSRHYFFCNLQRCLVHLVIACLCIISSSSNTLAAPGDDEQDIAHCEPECPKRPVAGIVYIKLDLEELGKREVEVKERQEGQAPLIDSSADESIEWDEGVFIENFQKLKLHAKELVKAEGIDKHSLATTVYNAFLAVSVLPLTWFATSNLFGLNMDTGVEGKFIYGTALLSVGMLFAESYVDTMSQLRELALSDEMTGIKKCKELTKMLGSIFVGMVCSVQDAVNARLGAPAVLAFLGLELEADETHRDNLGYWLFVGNLVAESCLFAYGLRQIGSTYYTSFHHMRHGTMTEDEKNKTKSALEFAKKVMPRLLKEREGERMVYEHIDAQDDELIAIAKDFRKWWWLHKWDPLHSKHLLHEMIKLIESGHEAGASDERSWYLTMRGALELTAMTFVGGAMAFWVTQLQLTGQQYSLLSHLGFDGSGSVIDPNATVPLDASLPPSHKALLGMGAVSYVLQSVAMAPLVDMPLFAATGIMISAAYLLYLKWHDREKYDHFYNILKNACSAQYWWEAVGYILAAAGSAGYVMIADGLYPHLQAVLAASESVTGNPLIVFPGAQTSIEGSKAALFGLLMNAKTSWVRFQAYLFPRIVDYLGSKICTSDEAETPESSEEGGELTVTEEPVAEEPIGKRQKEYNRRMKRWEEIEENRPPRSCVGYVFWVAGSVVRWFFDHQPPPAVHQD
ncbi:hypothetical protein [Candidatus Sororendozoicomonas aggregata]|uniref:hypothetical protein n=1 Tax=Candidatus Sororendozoicomonas aggregata TaxID=3073239 RepID=UPI002ED42CC0